MKDKKNLKIKIESSKFFNNALNKALLISISYLIFGSLWIISSDYLSGTWVSKISSLTEISIIKGLIFILISAVLIFFLVYPTIKKLITMQGNLENINTKLENLNLDLCLKTQELLKSEAKIKENEMFFRTIFNQAPIGIAIGNDDPYKNIDISTINPTFEKITGRTKAELANTKWTDITHPEDLQLDLEKFNDFKAGKIDKFDMDKRYIKPNGSIVWVHMLITPFILNDSKSNHLCLIEDISKRKNAEIALSESERSKRVLLSNLPGIAYRCNYDRDWTMQFISEGCFELTGYTAENLINNKDITFNEMIAPEYRDIVWNEWMRILPNRVPFRYEYEIITADNRRKWVLEIGQGIYNNKDNLEALEGIIIDISEQKQKETYIKYISEHHYISELYNRKYFEEFINNLELNENINSAVVLVIIRKFNLVNLSFGYQYGEKLIRKISEVLSLYCSNNCQIFHISTDRFAFYIKDYSTKDELVKFCDDLIITLKSILFIESIGASIGVIEIDETNCEVENILKKATIAAEYANENFNQPFTFSFFNKEMEAKIIYETSIKNELTNIVSENNNENLYLNYQPIFDLKTNKIYGFEALARLKSKDLGEISPLEFIPIAEETQLIIPIGKNIMYQAISFLKDLELKGYNDIKISVNASVIQLLTQDFYQDLKKFIDDIKVNPSNLIIELTESVFSDNYFEINKRIKNLKDLGINIAIDDFGTGYSSLARERELDIDTVKIDKYFIDKLLTIDENEAITSDIISMAHKLEHRVIAEGVENEKQWQYLLKHNCDCIQGFMFSKPLYQDEAINILEKTNK